jgi:UDP-GlcNAc:undecaprenyl-phosphate GlcNAc-1-phosphate transferase
MTTTFMLIFASALILAIAATPLARRAALRLGVLDQPNARKIHVNAIPLLGGVAIYGAFIVALLLFGDRFRLTELVGILVGASLVSFLGLWDDRRGLNPLLKLAGQCLAASILVVSGVYIGVAAVAAIYFLLLAAMNGQYLVGALSAALVGASFGFLIYNFNPASIFMGDAGSMFLGFILAAVGIKLRFPDGVEIVTWMVPVLILGLPLFDTALVIVSRLRRRLNPLTTPGKDHVSHRIVALGYTRREAVLTCYLICAGLGVVALFVTQAGIIEGYIVGGAVALVAIASLWRLEQVDYLGKEVRGEFLKRRKAH